MFRTLQTSMIIAAAAAALVAGCSDASSVADATTSDECAVTANVAVGQVLTGVSGSSLCFSGAAGGEFALIPFNAATSSDASADLTVSLTPRLSTFERRLHQLERSTLPRLMSPARLWRTQRSTASGGLTPRFSIASSAAVDDLVRLNADAESACAGKDYRTGRIAAISNRAIIVADTANPSGGFSATDFATIAATFDTLIDPVDRANFVDPTDIDENGHVVLFFTRAVNELTPAIPAEDAHTVAGASTSVTLDGGGVAYLRFAVTVGQPATITWSALPLTMNLSLVRTR